MARSLIAMCSAEYRRASEQLDRLDCRCCMLRVWAGYMCDVLFWEEGSEMVVAGEGTFLSGNRVFWGVFEEMQYWRGSWILDVDILGVFVDLVFFFFF